MIGVLSTVPGTVTWRRLSLAGEIPVAWLVALGRPGVRPNIGQSISFAARAGAAVAVASTVGVPVALGVAGGFCPPHAASVSAAPAASVATHRIPSDGSGSQR